MNHSKGLLHALALSIGLLWMFGADAQPSEFGPIRPGYPLATDLTVHCNEEVALKFILANPDPEPYVIAGISNTCMCIDLIDPPTEVPGQASAELIAVYRGEYRRGKRVSRLYLLPEGRREPYEIILHVQAEPLLAPTVEEIIFEEQVGASPLSQVVSFELVNHSSQDIALTLLAATPEQFSLRAEDMVVPAEGRITVDAHLDIMDPTLPRNGVARIRTDHPLMPSIHLPLRVVKPWQVSIDPQRVWFGILPPGRMASQMIGLYSADLGEDFHVLSAQLPEPGLEVEVYESSPGYIDIVVVLDTSEREPGLIDGTLLVQTNAPRQPLVAIEVVGQVTEE